LLSQRIECAELESWCLGMLRECLVSSSMRLGVPFIAPRQLGAVESIPGRQFLPSVAWRTGQSDADFFPILAQPTVGDSEPLAHRIVRCPLLTVGFATCRARIMRPTVGPADCWLTGQSGAPPDSPVIYSRTPLIASREQPVDRRRPGAPDTVRCTTGQSGAPKPSCLWLNKAISFPT
jgi:hypothetical protein